ncbi:MAG: sigma-54-dependent Fis family transcriptional regulator [Candidatus Eisenbacteria bacterium]|nr:sigma-54-dependent Fis family transcriptional regulator [Candidatus Eisenbacteria bacterium]
MSYRVLVIDDEELIRKSLTKLLVSRGYRVETASTAAQGLARVEEFGPQVVVLDLKLPDMTGLQVLARIREIDVTTEVVVITAFGDVSSAVEAMKAGACDFLKKPYEMEEICLSVEQAARSFERESQLNVFQTRALTRFSQETILGHCPAMEQVRELISKVARSEASTVLIEGESGTGKELVAHAIHYQSDRGRFPMMEVNCSSFQDQLLENELFGHERGAYTDAHAMKKGLVELCHRGTLFLDEVGDMAPGTQARLLRFLENLTFKRVGGTEEIKVDLRIVAATNKDLGRAVESGAFRQDLYYRLKVVNLYLPPLRDRGEDVLELVAHFLQEFNRKFKKQFRMIPEETREALLRYRWPGNVRELRNMLERILLLEEGEVVQPEYLPPEMQRALEEEAPPRAFALDGLRPTLAEVEERYIQEVLESVDGNKSHAARLLGVSRQGLIERIKRMERRSPQLSQ